MIYSFKTKKAGLPRPSPIASTASASTSVVKDQKRSSLCGLEIFGRGLSTAFISHHVKLEFLTLDNGTHASILDSGDMNEHVRSAVIWRDKAEAFGGVEEFDGSDGHDDSLQSALSRAAWPNAKRRSRRN
jgi:hypothetical protein